MRPTEEPLPVSLPFLGRSALLNGLFLLEAAASFLLDIVIAAAFGLGMQSDALYAAWMLPQAIGRGVFQSLTNSLLGLFAGQGNRSVAYNQAIVVIAVVAMPLAVLLSVASFWWLPLTIPGASPETQSIAVPLAGMLAWLVGFLALAETFRAIYYREGRWEIPSLIRLAGGLLASGLVVIAGRERNLSLAAWGMTVSAGLEALFSFAGLHLFLGLKFCPLWPKKSAWREMRTAVGAPLTGQVVRVLAGVVERVLASMLPPGTITAMVYANRAINVLERFVFRGFVISIIHVYSQGRKIKLSPYFRSVTLVSLPISIVLVALSRPLVAVVFGRGRFTAEDVQTLALALQAYAPAILAIALTRIPFGLAYAEKRGGIVFGYFALISIVLVLAEVLFIFLGLGLRVFGVSYTVSIWLSFVWLYWFVLRPRRECIFSWADGARLLAVGLSGWLGTALLASLMGHGESGTIWTDWLTLASGMVGGGVFLVAAAYVLRLDEVRQFFRMIQERRR